MSKGRNKKLLLERSCKDCKHLKELLLAPMGLQSYYFCKKFLNHLQKSSHKADYFLIQRCLSVVNSCELNGCTYLGD